MIGVESSIAEETNKFVLKIEDIVKQGFVEIVVLELENYLENNDWSFERIKKKLLTLEKVDPDIVRTAILYLLREAIALGWIETKIELITLKQETEDKEEEEETLILEHEVSDGYENNFTISSSYVGLKPELDPEEEERTIRHFYIEFKTN